MKRYTMTITILSPVHIGSGEQLDPLEYTVKDTFFYRLDTARFLASMTPAQRAKFDQALTTDNPVMMRKFIAEALDPKQYAMFMANTGPAFEAAYEKYSGSLNNQLLVELFQRCGLKQRPYLPGSSVKGAIRTSVISSLAKPGIPPRDYTNDRGRFPKKVGLWLEKKILGYDDPKADPFKMLRIADAPLSEQATFIDPVKIIKKDTLAGGPDPGGIQMFCEQCFSMLDGENITAAGTLEINDALVGKKGTDRWNNRVDAISMPLTVEQMIAACKGFYLPKMADEHETFYRGRAEIEENSRRLLDVTYADNEFPIRLGRFSHVECHTLDTYRAPVSRRGWGKTRTLSDGKMPMGWVKVKLTPAG